MTEAKLLVCIISREKKLEEVLEALLEKGYSGASILDVRGMLEYLADEIPLFAGFRSLIHTETKKNKMILSVIPGDAALNEAMDIIERVYGSFSDTNTGIMFSLDLSNLRGLKF